MSRPAVMPTIVYKLGGSLLAWPELPQRFRRLLNERRAADAGACPMIVAGGGAAADLVREWDRLHHLGEESAHHLALEALRLNDAVLLRLLPETRSVTSHAQAAACWNAGRIPLLNVAEFLRQWEPQSDWNLPHTWDVSSDSIAAWITLVWPAAELVLVKSTSRRLGQSLDESAASGLVDAYFPKLAIRLPRWSWTNLRETINE